MDHVTDDFYKGVANLGEVIYDSFQFAKVYEIFGPKWKDVASVVCLFAKDFCKKEVLGGIQVNDYVNEFRVRVANTREPAGASVKSLLHFTQLMKTSEFQQFNYYDGDKNRDHYDGRVDPPIINLDNVSKTNIPVAMFVAEHDRMATDKDSRKLAKKLGPQTVIEYTVVKNFDHYSFSMYKPGSNEAEAYLKRLAYWVQ